MLINTHIVLFSKLHTAASEASGLRLRTKLNIGIPRPFGYLARATFCSKFNHRMLYFKFKMAASEAMEAIEVKKDFTNGFRI